MSPYRFPRSYTFLCNPCCKRFYNSLLALFSVSSAGANMFRKSAAKNSIQMLVQ